MYNKIASFIILIIGPCQQETQRNRATCTLIYIFTYYGIVHEVQRKFQALLTSTRNDVKHRPQAVAQLSYYKCQWLPNIERWARRSPRESVPIVCCVQVLVVFVFLHRLRERH